MTRTAAMVFLTILAVGAAACDQTPAGPAQLAPADAAQYVGNGPAHPGMSPVFRFGNNQEVASWDEAHDLVAAYYDPDVLCASGNQDLSTMPVFEMQVIALPMLQATMVHFQSAGEVPVVVFRLSEIMAFLATGPEDAEICDALTTWWLYRGTAKVQYEDNNNAFQPTRTNVWGWTGNGNVEDQDGNAYRYLNRARYVVDPEPFRILVQDETIRITPR